VHLNTHILSETCLPMRLQVMEMTSNIYDMISFSSAKISGLCEKGALLEVEVSFFCNLFITHFILFSIVDILNYVFLLHLSLQQPGYQSGLHKS